MLAPSKTIPELLAAAKAAIDSGESSMHIAAEAIAQAQAQGATQRKIAETVDKSAAWVNGLLQWRIGGYQGTCFGPQKQRARPTAEASPKADPAFSQTKHAKPKSEERAQADTAKAEASKARAKASQAKADAEKAKADARKAEADARKAKAEANAQAKWKRDRDNAFAGAFRHRTPGSKEPKMTHAQRRTLVGLLGHLGNDNAGQRDVAATKADKLRNELGVGWDDLIVRAA
jgi:hypothetical protein